MIPIAAPDIGAHEIDEVQGVLESGQLADGQEVRRFEREFAEFCGTDHAVATTNGTTALHAALEAMEVCTGDSVVTTPFSFIASANAIRHAGATPVFADVEPTALTLDPTAVEAILSDRDDVVGILPVHLYGTPADLSALAELAEIYDVALVEDAAQAHGARHDGEPVGSVGDVGCFSFYPTKNMTAGEGGMITTDDPAIAERAARFCDHGRTARYEHGEIGHNFRMTSICAAIGRTQLAKLSTYNLARRGNAAYLSDALADTAVETPTEPRAARSVYHQYTVRTDDRDALQHHLERRDVDSGIYYPIPIHQQPPYDDVAGTFPVAERAADRVLSLPVHPDLSPTELSAIAEAVTAFDPAGTTPMVPDAGRSDT